MNIIQTNVLQFCQYTHDNYKNISPLQQKFKELFPDNTIFDIDDTLYFFDQLRTMSIKVNKAFSLAISYQLADQMFQYLEKDISEPEDICAYITLRHCRDLPKINAEEILNKMEAVSLTDQHSRYRFAKFALQQNVSDFIENLSDFEIDDPTYMRRLAEKTLYLSAHSFFEDMNEFDFREKEIREEFFLRGLMRSTDVVYDLMDDFDFIEGYKKLSQKTLEFLYEKFTFCKETTQKIIDNDLDKKIENNQELFVSIFKKPSFYNQAFINADFFIKELKDQHKGKFLAMIFFIKSFKNPDSVLENPEVIDFLNEIASFPDPSIPFAAVAILRERVKCGHDPLKQLTLFESPEKSKYPKLCSLAIAVYKHLFPDEKTSDWVIKQWKHQDSRKHFLKFLAELFLSEKLEYMHKQFILKELISNIELHKLKNFIPILIDYSICIARGLTKHLKEGMSPHLILSVSQLSLINQLGAAQGFLLTVEQFDRLSYKQDIVYYAQSLEKLADIDEKKTMISFFFRFLHLISEGELDEMRMTSELNALFKDFKLNLDIWNTEKIATVNTLLESNKYQLSAIEELNIQEAINGSFRQSHLQTFDYREFCLYAFERKILAPKLQGKDYGTRIQKYSSLPEDEKKKIQTHLLCELFEEKNPNKQLATIGKMKKVFPANEDFNVTDLKNWEKILQIQTDSNKNPMKEYETLKDYEIIRNSDPYILFRIGSIGGETCLRVTGDPAKNKSLLGFACDGKNQVIYAKSGLKEPEACAIIRFFYACKSHKEKPLFPVLYLEPVYPGSAHKILKDSITFSAIQCAKELGVPLVRRFKPQEKTENESGYEYVLKTINGPAPFEHYDGLSLQVKPNNSFNESTGSSQTYTGWIQGSDVKLVYDPNIYNIK